MSDIQAIRTEIKNMKPHVEHKDIAQEVKKEVLPTSLEAQQRAENARKSAHKLTADMKREISMEIKNKLSESFDFIEESCGSGSPVFEFYKEPTVITEGLEMGAPAYPVIGRASGVFAPIGVMSRNNRIYDNDHYDYLLDNQQLVERINHRGMLGTIGHYDKKVDDRDLAEGKVSHIVTNLKIVEEADGTRNLHGTLEILDTPAGHLLKTYYDSGIPLFVSSRGGGNLLPVPNESYKRVDKTKYFLETFDIVSNPGFLQAKPVYEKIGESMEDKIEVVTEAVLEEVKEEPKSDITLLAEAFMGILNTLESKQEDKAEGNEKAEAKEKKEAKEKSEAKEAHETAIEEGAMTVGADRYQLDSLDGSKDPATGKKDGKAVDKEEFKKRLEKQNAEIDARKLAKIKEAVEQLAELFEKKDEDEKDKPEDEKHEDEEDAVASSVSEASYEDLSKRGQKAVDKMMDPHAGMTKADVQNGAEQLKMISREDAINNMKAAEDQRKQINAERKKYTIKKAPEKTQQHASQQLSLALESLQATVQGSMGICEVSRELAQKVVDRKTKQLVNSGNEMKNTETAFRNKMSTDGIAMQNNGQLQSKSTNSASRDHKESIQKGANLNRGAMVIAKAGKKKGCDIDNLKHAGQGHAQEVNRQAQSHRDIKHMHEGQESNQPIATVQGVGEISKNAQKIDTKIEEPLTMDRQELARTLKAKALAKKEDNK